MRSHHLKAALIGFGAIARYGHLPWYLNTENVELVAIAEPTLDGRAIAKKILPTVSVFSDIDNLLKTTPVTFVDITAHPAAHCDLITKAMVAGVHSICEKPFVTSLEELQKIDVLRGSEPPLIAACHNWCFAPPIVRILELIREGKIGEPDKIIFEAHRLKPASGAEHWKPTWRQLKSEGGGVIADLGYHGFYLAARVFGTAPHAVTVNLTQRGSDFDEAESTALVELLYDGHRQARLSLSWDSLVRKTILRIFGSAGSITIEDNILHVSDGRTNSREQCDSLTADSWHPTWIAGALNNFIAGIQKQEPNEFWKEIRWTVSTLHAAHESTRTGRTAETATSQVGVSLAPSKRD